MDPQGTLFPTLDAAPATGAPVTRTPAARDAVASAPLDLERHLQRLFGFTSFRPGQREAIEAVLAGHDALAVMPTGGGKSMTYLLPAFLQPGVTIVVSPLLSLIQDQVSKLTARGLPATCLSSQVPWDEQQRRLERLRQGGLKLLFVAPERFRNQRFLRALDGVRVSLLAVDEAHCVSQWGHDFRPDYLRLPEAIRACGRPPVLAVTATATRQVRDDITRQLELGPELVTLVRGFERPNLHLSVVQVAGGRGEKLRVLDQLIRQARAAAPAGKPAPGIIYCGTRKDCDRLARDLSRAGHEKLGVYHAGLTGPARARVQERFFAGDVELVVATNAFGLGIDKQDVRFVLHHDLPGSLEAYYQEAGRAGRDGLPARCALVFGFQDVHLQRFFIETAHPARQLVTSVAHLLPTVGPEPEALRARLPEKPSERAIGAALRLLEQAGGELDQVDFEAVKARAAHDEALLRRLLAYVREPGCRHRAVLRYFGAPTGAAEACGACDHCKPDPASPKSTASGSASASASAPLARTPRASASPRSPAAKKPARAATSADADGDDANPELLKKLRGLRGALATKRRVPPYRVFHDRTILELAARRPSTRDELLEIYGLGERTVDQFGDAILRVIANNA